MKKPRRLLLIDDDVPGSSIVAIGLRERGFEVHLLHDSRHTAEMLNRTKPELILLDIIMPDVTGQDILKTLRASASPFDLPIVMMTSLDGSADIAKCLKLGANDYITKPVDMEVAVARINTHLTLADLNRENMLRKERETLQAMIATYNHEINNPLAIATVILGLGPGEMDQEKFDSLRNAVSRITEIVKKIGNLTAHAVQIEEYISGSSIVKL